MILMKRGSRKWSITACALVVSVALAACDGGAGAGGEPQQGQGTGETSKPVKIVGLSYNPIYDRPGEQQDKVHDIVMKETGADVEIVFTPSDQFKNRLNLMLSSNEQLDFAEVSVADAIDLYSKKAIIPINKLLDQFGANLKQNVKSEAFQAVTYNGDILGVPREAPVITPDALQVRVDWLKKLNLNVPKTVPEFEAVMEAFKTKDPDGNGQADTFPLTSGWGTFDKLEKVFSPSFLPQAMAWWKDSDGTIKPPELHPAYAEMMGKFVEWNKKGYIWPDLVLSTTPKQQEVIAQNKSGAVAGWFSSTLVNAVEVLNKTVPEADYLPILLKGTGSNALETVKAAGTVIVIFKKSVNPDKVMQFFDYQGTYDGNMLVYFGVKGENYNLLDNGMVEFISSNKADLNTAKYYAKYLWVYINWRDRPTWPINNWTGEQYNRKKAEAESLPRFDAIDKHVFYDQSKWKSQPRLNDLATFLQEQKIKVFSGETPLSDWEKLMKTWLDMGGQQMIKDRNEQFKAAS